MCPTFQERAAAVLGAQGLGFQPHTTYLTPNRLLIATESTIDCQFMSVSLSRTTEDATEARVGDLRRLERVAMAGADAERHRAMPCSVNTEAPYLHHEAQC